MSEKGRVTFEKEKNRDQKGPFESLTKVSQNKYKANANSGVVVQVSFIFRARFLFPNRARSGIRVSFSDLEQEWTKN